jgi:methylenetetrahydrofolate reductase (NADPH)
MTEFCKTKVPEEVALAIEIIKDDEQKVKDYGIELAKKMCEEMIDNGVRFLHMYTLNLETSVIALIK